MLGPYPQCRVQTRAGERQHVHAFDADLLLTVKGGAKAVPNRPAPFTLSRGGGPSHIYVSVCLCVKACLTIVTCGLY